MPEKRYVRSFLFSVRIDSPLARLHVLTKLWAILALSVVIVRAMRTDDPDPVMALLLLLLAFLALYLGGVMRWLFRSYLLVLWPAMLGIALTWLVFYPARQGETLFRLPVYDGRLSIGVSLGLGIWAACVAAWYALRKGVFWGIVGGLILAWAVTASMGNPKLAIVELDVYRPVAIAVSSSKLVIAATKALGYAAMICVSLMLVTTSRDVEVTGVMVQLGVPAVVTFFVSTMLRSLSMALTDYETIRQAQMARGVTFKKRNLYRVLADLAYMAVPLTANMLRRAREVGDAALLRGFSMQTRGWTEFHEVRPFAWADGAVVGFCALCLVGTHVLGIHLTRLVGIAW